MAKIEYQSFLDSERSLRWLRGLSVKQFRACDKLLHALRDDIEQESTYRVHECLTELGLRPMLTSRQIKSIMAISQASDLAFLWFIWEAFYKSERDAKTGVKKYLINEQLIMSAIAHLDMTTTMRALDEILPTSDHSKKYQDKKRAEQLRKEEKKRTMREERRPMPQFCIDLKIPLYLRMQQLKEARRLGKNRKTRTIEGHDKILPYMTPQLRPKFYEPTAMRSKPCERKVEFPTYAKYKDKHFCIPNEKSRWFSSYVLSPVKREIKKCLNDALAPLFGGSRKPLQHSVCNVHRMLEFAASRKEQMLLVQTMQHCMKLLEENKVSNIRRRHIVSQIEEDIECVAQKLHNLAKHQLTELQLLLGGTCNVGKGCQMCAQLASTPGHQRGPKADMSFLLDFDFTLGHPPPEEAEKDEPVKVYELGERRLMKLLPVEEDLSVINTLGKNAHCWYAGQKHQSLKKCLSREGVIKILDDQGKVAKTVKPSEMKFCPPDRQTSDTSADRFCSRKTMKSGVLQWDYFKIYQQNLFEAEEQFRDTRSVVRSYCIDALNQAMEQRLSGGAEQQRNETFRHIKSDSALETAERVAKQQFRDAVKSKSLTIGMEKSMMEKEEEKQNTKFDKAMIAEKFMSMVPIDPNDRTTLIKLLKTAIQIMQQDTKYVLATLPNAHMMPTLIDWVADRYGKTYNYQQTKNMDRSLRLVRTHHGRVSSIGQNVPYPNKKYIQGYKCIESYDKFNELFCKVGQTQDDYFYRLNQMALEESRVLWFAMHGFSNIAGSLTDTYFAYLPAKELDFLRHHLWNSRDYRNMVRSKIR